VYTVVRNMTATASDANKLTHQTFISAYGEIASMPHDATFRTWLFGIAMKNFFAARSGQVGAARSPEWLPTKGNEAGVRMMLTRRWRDLTDPALELGNLTLPLREALRRMDDGTRAAFVLNDLAELPATETAAILQTTPREIHKRVRCARLTLMSVL